MFIYSRVIFFSLFFLAPCLSCHSADAIDKETDSVLVMPFADLAQPSGASDKVTDMFARELVKAGGYRVYHPQLVRKYLSGRKDHLENSGSSEEAIKTAKTFGARYVISGIITEYDGFPPFSLDISVEMFDVESRERLSADSISRAGQSVWQRLAPFTKKQTMDQYVRDVCAQLITRSFEKKVPAKNYKQ